MFWNASGLTERSNKSSSSSPTILPHQQVPAASEFQRGGQKRGGRASSRWSLKNLHGSAIVGLVIIVVIGSICQLEHMVNPGQPSIFQISSLLAAYIGGANPVDLQGSSGRNCGNSYDNIFMSMTEEEEEEEEEEAMSLCDYYEFIHTGKIDTL